MNQELLDKVETRIDSLKMHHKSGEPPIRNIYFCVSDVISLTLLKGPSSFYDGSKANSSLTPSAPKGGSHYKNYNGLWCANIWRRDSYHVLTKTGAYTIASTGSGLAVDAFSSLPLVGVLAVTVVVGFAANATIDYVYDKIKNLLEMHWSR